MISSIIHTYNEEQNIGRCLSALNFADEIIVVDMGSRDKTREIAKEFDAKIFDHPYTGFVETSRNFGIKKAKGDWILIVDADEAIPRSLANRLSQIEKNDKDISFVRIPRKNIIFGKWIKHSGWWPDYQIRFFKKGSVEWGSKIHNIPTTKGRGIDIEANENLSFIHHHYQTINQFLERLNRYTSIQAKELFIENKSYGIKELILRPINEFVKRFFMMEGYKDGIHGLALGLLQAFSEAVVVLKVWEFSGFRETDIKLNEFAKISKDAEKIRKYWLLNELIKKPQNSIKNLYLRMLRKIYS